MHCRVKRGNINGNKSIDQAPRPRQPADGRRTAAFGSQLSNGSNSANREAGTAENGATKAIRAADASADNEIDLLKAQLAAQQEELAALRKAVEEQGKLLALVLKTNTNAASSPAAASNANQLTERATPPIESNEAPGADPLRRSSPAIAEEDKPSPLSFRIGTAHFTPFGFVDFTAVIRDKNLGSGIGTNFGAAPFSNTVNGKLSEFRLSAQN